MKLGLGSRSWTARSIVAVGLVALVSVSCHTAAQKKSSGVTPEDGANPTVYARWRNDGGVVRIDVKVREAGSLPADGTAMDVWFASHMQTDHGVTLPVYGAIPVHLTNANAASSLTWVEYNVPMTFDTSKDCFHVKIAVVANGGTVLTTKERSFTLPEAQPFALFP